MALATLIGASNASALTITIVNLDGSLEGFNDATPVVAVGGNSGTTLGEQRLKVFEHAASIWAAVLAGSVEVRVGANFDPLTCTASSATLGQAGPTTVHRDFAGALVAGTWYPQALANQLAGADLDNLNDDIAAQFNASIGTTCAFPCTWYYGLDGNPPGCDIDLLSVVLHEIGHGLGFLTLVDRVTGAKFLGRDDAFMLSLEDHSLGLSYDQMSNAERAAANVATGDLHWIGPAVVGVSAVLSAGVNVDGHVEMFAPNPSQPGSSLSHFSDVLSPDEAMEPFYTSPNHSPGLALELLEDLGWDASLCGDVNADGVVNIVDALLVAQLSVHLRECSSMANAGVCDINPVGASDGTCNIADALRMAQCDVGLISCGFSCVPLFCAPAAAP
ncbi:MAG: hypothetical protein ACE5E4_02255 [Candidatus Binatia bacterium]